MNQEFKNVLSEIKYKYHITQADIAEKIGANRSYLSEVVNGRAQYSDALKEKIKAAFPTLSCFEQYNPDVENAIMSFMRSNLFTVDDLAKRIGVSGIEVTETIALGFTEESAKRWSDTFGFDKDFLLTGNGQLIPSKETRVPLIPITAQAGRLSNFASSVSEYECEKIVSPIKDAELAIPITGESMAPEFPSGSIVFVKKINEKVFIEWGKPYVLDTVNGAVIKYLAPGKDGCVKCISVNADPMYAPFEIPLSEVYGIYRIVNMLCMK